MDHVCTWGSALESCPASVWHGGLDHHWGIRTHAISRFKAMNHWPIFHAMRPWRARVRSTGHPLRWNRDWPLFRIIICTPSVGYCSGAAHLKPLKKILAILPSRRFIEQLIDGLYYTGRGQTFLTMLINYLLPSCCILWKSGSYPLTTTQHQPITRGCGLDGFNSTDISTCFFTFFLAPTCYKWKRDSQAVCPPTCSLCFL